MAQNGDDDGDTMSLGGAGGKLRRQRPRRPSSTPYARPPENEALRRRWISRLVDPARRLIAGGLTKILPYLLPQSSSLTALSPPSDPTEQEDQDELNTELKQHSGSGDTLQTKNLSESGLPKVPGPSRTADKYTSQNISSDERGKKVVSSDDGLSEIEQLMDGKRFSKDEIDRLIEILNSKAVGPSTVECGKGNNEVGGEKEAESPRGFLVDSEKPLESTKENIDFAPLATPKPLLKSTVSDEIGRSPIEIARAYMGSRGSHICLGSNGLLDKEDRPPLHADEIAGKQFFPSPSPKPSTCWPGAMLPDQYNYASPQIQRVRYGLQNYPRTPYSRSIFSKSKSQLGILQESGRRTENLFTSYQQMPTSSVQVRFRNKTIADELGSVGPIRRTRNKAVVQSPPTGSVYARSGPSTMPTSNLPEGFFPAIKKNREHGPSTSSQIHRMEREPTSSALATPTVHPHSSQVARTILEHLERTQPTPKDKYAELKIATSWRKESNTGVGYKKNTDYTNTNSMDQFIGGRSKASLDDANNDRREKTLSAFEVGSTAATDSNNSGPSFTFPEVQDSQHVKISHAATKKLVPSDPVSEVPKTVKSSHNLLGTRPTPPAITVENPITKWIFPSGNSTGFSFPVPASSGTSSEPPTPSFLPTTSPDVLVDPPKEEAAVVASYGFGTKKTSQTLVFSFPWVSGKTEGDEVSDIKFEFGSDKSGRISFAIPSVN